MTRVNLVRGWPAATLLPSRLLANAFANLLDHPQRSPRKPGDSVEYEDLSATEQALLYGPDPGHLELRKSLAGCCEKEGLRPPLNQFERISITGGAAQSLAVILGTLTDPIVTRAIWIVVPAYFLAFGVFSDAGFADKLHPVPESADGDGLDIEYLREEIAKVDAQFERDETSQKGVKPTHECIFKHIIYVVPTFANPSGVTTSAEKRRQLVKLAKSTDSLVVCDDVYDMLNYDDKPSLPRVIDFEQHEQEQQQDGAANTSGRGRLPGNVISNGSFSKLAGPGLRVGWIVAHPRLAYLLSQNGGTKSGGAPSQLVSVAMTPLVTGGALSKHIGEVLVPAYRKRRAALMDQVVRELVPLGCKIDVAQPAGGFFAWLGLPPSITAQRLADACAKHDPPLFVAPGTMFQVPGAATTSSLNRFDSYVRLCFAWEETKSIELGISILAKVLAQVQQRQASGGADAQDSAAHDPLAHA